MRELLVASRRADRALFPLVCGGLDWQAEGAIGLCGTRVLELGLMVVHGGGALVTRLPAAVLLVHVR